MDDSRKISTIAKNLKCSQFLLELQDSLRNEIKKPLLYSGDIKKHIQKFIKDSGYEVQLQNIVFKVVSEWDTNAIIDMSREEAEPLDYIRKAQRSWEKCIVKSINSMCTELSLPLSRKRNSTDRDLLAEKFESMSLGAEYNDATYAKLRPVYSATDFFEVLGTVTSSNESRSPKSSIQSWYLIKAQLFVPTYEELRQQFKHLTGHDHQIGIDDSSDLSFYSDWMKVGQRVIVKRHMGAARQYLKQGCLPGLRKHIWSTILDVNVTDADILYYEQLKSSVFEYDMLIDYLIMKDVRLTATNDDSFFVFEDVLYQVLLTFSRDTKILQHFNYSSASPPKSYIRGKLGVDEFCVNYPPCGVFPFHGFSMIAAPLCYVFDNPVELFYVFRCLYTRYFFRLHTISSHPQGILSLCNLFEKLLQATEANTYKHLLNIGAQPLKLVFNWFLFGYSGYLATDETLQLWDRLLGYNSLYILPVLGVAIISYRKENLLSVTTLAACEAILADISTIKVIPVLVHFLSGRQF